MSSDILSRARAVAAAGRAASNLLLDDERICGLDRFLPSEEEQQALAQKWTRLLRRHPRAKPLRPIQGYILETAHRALSVPAVGLLGNVGVGKGKTLAFLNLPRVMGAERAVLFIPPDMRKDLDEARWEWSQHYDFGDLTVLAYSDLSKAEGTDLLRRLNPDLIMADECQALRYATAARTMRFIRFMREFPDTRFVGMSGTLSTTGLEDYAHLAEIACRGHSPVPLDDSVVKKWASVLDAGGEPDDFAWQALEPLVQTFGPAGWSAPSTDDATPRDRQVVREAFAERFKSAPFCVGTVSSSCDKQLVVETERPPLNDAATEALRVLHQDYELPDGTPVVDGLHFARACSQLSLGFYYVWDWPDDEVDAEWMEARSRWASSIRWYLKHYAREGCDSPFLVEDYVRGAIKKGKDISQEMVEALTQWDEQRAKDPPPTKAIWLDTGPIVHAIMWARQREKALLWYRSRAVGEMLHMLGIPTFGAGDGKFTIEATPIAAVSWRVYHKGKDWMTDWQHQLVLEPGPNGAEWEQMLGRLHRPGQEHDTVFTSVFYHTWPLQLAMARALERSEYIQATSSQPQKLLAAERRGFRKLVVNPYDMG